MKFNISDNNDGHFCENVKLGKYVGQIKSYRIIKQIYLTQTLDKMNNAIGKHLIKLGNPHLFLYIKDGPKKT